MAALPLDDQVRALLQGRAFRVVESMFQGRRLSGNEYAQIFTVKRADVLAYVREHGFPSGSYSACPRMTDGAYMIEEDGQYVVYYQERGIRFDESRHSSKAAAEQVMVDLLLSLSGTGPYDRA